MPLCGFQVPKGMLQTQMTETVRCFKVKEVSSPQGNATNSIDSPVYRRKSLSFKSPRECYKRSNGSPFRTQLFLFQVPKGMLQTQLLASLNPYGAFRFKSPRECYKRHTLHRPPFCDWRFKSPRECYKLSMRKEFEITKRGFKSPRECYKQFLPPVRALRSFVSSPQGNATNLILFQKYIVLWQSFKSPRECYKLS